MVRNQRDNPQATFEVTNWTEDLDMDCDATADAAICDVLGTLIKELIEAGVIQGSVSS